MWVDASRAVVPRGAVRAVTSRRPVITRAVATPAPPPRPGTLLQAPGSVQATPEWVGRWGDNASLTGNFAPVANELTLHNLRIDGALPASVDGVYLRNVRHWPRQGGPEKATRL